jgi:hypothetical protein
LAGAARAWLLGVAFAAFLPFVGGSFGEGSLKLSF